MLNDYRPVFSLRGGGLITFAIADELRSYVLRLPGRRHEHLTGRFRRICRDKSFVARSHQVGDMDRGIAPMSVSVAIANPKGGVGKSLTTMMLADGLALSYGARILVIDADPQAGVTKSLLGIGAEQELRRSQIGLSAILQAFSRGEDTE